MLSKWTFITVCTIVVGYVSGAEKDACPDNCRNNVCSHEGICKDCKDGFYSIRCTQTCPPNCVDRACFRYNVSCSKGCNSGWYGRKCENKCQNNCAVCGRHGNICSRCKNGFYGQTCEKQCGRCNGTCSQEGGLCESGCVDGYYTARCAERCNVNCVTVSTSGALPWCNQTSGSCLFGCKRGFYGTFCSQICQKNCTFASQYKSCKQTCKRKEETQTLSETLGGSYSDHGGGVTSSVEEPDWGQTEGSPKPSRMLIGFVVAGVGLICLLLIMTWFVIAPKKKHKRRSDYRRRSKTSRASNCRCGTCTHCDGVPTQPVRFEPRPCRGMRQELSFVNYCSTNHGRTWCRPTHHIPHARSDTSNGSIEDPTYEEVRPVPSISSIV